MYVHTHEQLVYSSALSLQSLLQFLPSLGIALSKAVLKVAMKLQRVFKILAFCLSSNGILCAADRLSAEVKETVPRQRDDFHINTRAQSYKEESAIALQRRNESISKFFQMPLVKEEDLPLDLRSFRETSGLLSKDELDITNSDAETLLRKIKSQQLSSVEVTKAFCKAAVIAQNLVCRQKRYFICDRNAG